MAKINVLDSSVFNLISAGEVVERPSSVVKELVENSIDAGATAITVEIKDGGISSIIITDNGCGIDKENMKLAFLPHATSKLSKAEDLDSISTLGFRGEALASISAVAQVTMTSKTVDDEVGNFIKLSAGKVAEEGKKAISQSTSISVENLFFNTPVRKKFLKKPKQEEALVTSVMSQLALANPDIKFKYVVDGKVVFQSNGGLEEAIYSIYGNDIANNLLPFDFTFGEYRIYGYTGNPSIAKHNRNYQTVIINGRVIVNATISTAVSQAYGSRLMTRTFPVFILNIVMPFQDVDVNVHPTKTDVRFADSHKVFSCVYKAILNTLVAQEQNLVFGKKQQDNSQLNGNIKENEEEVLNTTRNSSRNTAEIKQDNMPKNQSVDKDFLDGDVISEKNYKDLLEKQKQVVAEIQYHKDSAKHNMSVADSKGFSTYYSNKKNGRENVSEKAAGDKTVSSVKPEQSSLLNFIDEQLDNQFKVVGQIFNAFLIVESDDIVYFIDQHACHERIIYDKLLEEVNSNSINVQYMLIPYILECDSSQYDYILRIKDNLKDLGFDIEEFGGMSFKINSVPHLLNEINLAVFFDNLFSERASLSMKSSDLIRDKLAQKACKSAIKAGAELDNEQIKSLINSMKDGIPLQCPHGRPAVISYTRRDFDKLFKRIV